jgi:hypothetical protein
MARWKPLDMVDLPAFLLLLDPAVETHLGACGRRGGLRGGAGAQSGHQPRSGGVQFGERALVLDAPLGGIFRGRWPALVRRHGLAREVRRVHVVVHGVGFEQGEITVVLRHGVVERAAVAGQLSRRLDVCGSAGGDERHR